MCEDNVGLQVDQFLREHPCPIDTTGGPANVYPNVAAIIPTQLRKSPYELGELCLGVSIVLGVWHQHADPPHPLRLLRMRRERPCDRGAAESD